MNTKDIGDISEAAVLAELTRAGLAVLLPFGDNRRYDFVVDDAGRFVRVQVKTARIRNGVLTFSTFSKTTRAGGIRVERNYTAAEVDVFAAWEPTTASLYVVPVRECCRGHQSLRLSPTRNGQRARVRDAAQFAFGGALTI